MKLEERLPPVLTFKWQKTRAAFKSTVCMLNLPIVITQITFGQITVESQST